MLWAMIQWCLSHQMHVMNHQMFVNKTKHSWFQPVIKTNDEGGGAMCLWWWLWTEFLLRYVKDILCHRVIRRSDLFFLQKKKSPKQNTVSVKSFSPLSSFLPSFFPVYSSEAFLVFDYQTLTSISLATLAASPTSHSRLKVTAWGDAKWLLLFWRPVHFIKRFAYQISLTTSGLVLEML